MNLLIQVNEGKDYDYKKINHGTEMISRKKLEKTNYSLVVKINQTSILFWQKKRLQKYKNRPYHRKVLIAEI